MASCGCKHPSWLKCICACHASIPRPTVNLKRARLIARMAEKSETKRKVKVWREQNFDVGLLPRREYDEPALWIRLGLSEPIVVSEITPLEHLPCVICRNRAVRCSRRYCSGNHCPEYVCEIAVHGEESRRGSVGRERISQLVFFGKELE